MYSEISNTYKVEFLRLMHCMKSTYLPLRINVNQHSNCCSVTWNQQPILARSCLVFDRSKYWTYFIFWRISRNVKPKISPHMHKKVFLKSIYKCFIRFTVSLKYVYDFHFHRQWAQTAFYSTWNLKCRAASDNNNQNSPYYFIRNVHLTVVTLHIVLY